MKKGGKVFLIIVIVIGLIICGVISWSDIANAIDEKKVATAYGEKVELDDGRKINICTYGDGDETLVVLPGFGAVSPAYEYKGLASKLKGYTVVVVEPLGYGLSDQTDVERTSENICSEIHEVLQKKGITHYTLMAHSIAGLYSMNYIQMYGGEIDRFIGLDITVPNVNSEEVTTLEPTVKSTLIMKKLGVLRILCMSAPDDQIILPGLSEYLDSSEIAIYRKMAYTNSVNKTMLNEAKNLASNAAALEGYKLPKDLKVNLYVSSTNYDSVDNWYEDHLALIDGCDDATCDVLEGTHYLHLSCTDELAKSILANK